MSRKLGQFIHDLSYQDLPQEVVHMAKLRILDALACVFAGRNLPHSRIAVEVAKRSRGNSTLFGRKEKVALLEAVQANAVLVHSIMQDDVLGGITHPSTTVVPAVIGVAEQESTTGREALTATVLGYELIGRILRATGRFAVSSFRPGPILSIFGATAVAGKLMRLDEEQLANAVCYAASLAPGTPNEVWWGGTMEAVFEAGVSARIGILSAILAGAGATAAPEGLEGKHGFFRCWGGITASMEKATEYLGQSFAIMQTRIKPFPVCGANQVPVLVARPLAKHNLRPEDIVKIVERLPSGAVDYAGLDFAGTFTSQFQALMSMQFCAAAAILGKPIDSVEFFAEHYDDLEVGQVAQKVELVCEEGRSGPRFEVYTKDEKVYIAEEETRDRGRYQATTENMIQKFRAMSSDFLGEARTNQVIDLILNLDEADDIRKLTARLGE